MQGISRLLKFSFYVFPIIFVVLAPSLFLKPYFSLSGQMKCLEGPLTLNLDPGTFRLFTKSTCGLQKPPHMLISLLVGSDYDSGIIGRCPHGFHDHSASLAHDVLYEDQVTKPCIKLIQQQFDYLEWDYSFERQLNLRYHGPNARSTEVFYFDFEIPKSLIETQEDYEILTSLFVVDKYELECHADADCEAFEAEVRQTIIDNPDFVPVGHAFCSRRVAHSAWSYSGCAMNVVRGNSSHCHEDVDVFGLNFHSQVPITPECAFLSWVQLFPADIPSVFFPEYWHFSSLIFVICVPIHMFLSLYYWRRLHLMYLSSHYYMHAEPFPIEKGKVYYVKCLLVGKQFSAIEGVLRLYSSAEDVFSVPFDISLGDGGSNNTLVTTLVRGKFRATHDVPCCYADVENSDWQSAGNSSLNAARIIIRKEMPLLVKTRANFFPLLYFISLFDKKRFSGLISYTYLFFFNLSAWIVLVIYIAFSYLSFFRPQYVFWATSTLASPSVSLLAYILFIIFLFIPHLLVLSGVFRPIEESYQQHYVEFKERTYYDSDPEDEEIGLPVLITTSRNNEALSYSCLELEHYEGDIKEPLLKRS
ncbi:hypothetical protein PCE1_003268 [Barthelona sp. PCE]